MCRYDRHALVKTVTLDRSGAVRPTTIVVIIAIAVAAFILVANVKLPVPKQDTLAERREEAKQTGREIKSVCAASWALCRWVKRQKVFSGSDAIGMS